MRHPLATLFLLLGALVGCRSGVPYPERMYHEVIELAQSHEGTGGLRQDVRDKMDRKYGSVVSWAEEGMLETGEDYFFAAATLFNSDRLEHLELSIELSLRAAEMGEQRAYPTHAATVDKMSYHLGDNVQRYGTHMVFTPVLGRFEIHPPADPRTTDEERKAMGLPSLAELQAMVDELNASEEVDVLRGSVQHSRD